MFRRRRSIIAAIVAVAAGVAIVFSYWPRFGDSSRDSPSDPVALPTTPVTLVPPKAGRTSLPLRAGHFVPFACEATFDGLTFFDPLFVAPLPDASGRLAVVERRGTIQLVSQREGKFSKQLLLDITARVQTRRDAAEEGLLGLAFHPQFAAPESPHRGEFFVAYVARGSGPELSSNRLSRFRMKAGSLDVPDLDSEQVLIDQPQYFQAHNGGCVLFGPDGFLYYSVGDDAVPPPNPNLRTVSNNLFAGVLRIDVDCRGGSISHPPPRAPTDGTATGYYIPKSNPFVGRPDTLEEFYAIGLRNPWRMSFDRATGVFYVSDVGDRRREEVNVVVPGSNCGWDYFEGTLAHNSFDPSAPAPPAKMLGVDTPPMHEYSRDAAHRCIIGGYVYRGKQFPELVGRYVYADQSGRIYAIDLAENGRRGKENKLIAVVPDLGIGISSLGEDESGELYFCTIGQLATETGRIYRLRRTSESERDHLPDDLAATGIFSNWQTLTPNAGVTFYDINVPFWSDGADKKRWIAVPPRETVGVDPHGTFLYPPGTVLAKHFDLPTDLRNPAKKRPLETRVLVCDDRGGVYGAAYRWSLDGSHARLVTFNETETISVTQADGSQLAQTWTYPGRFECALCHNDASGQVLGFNLRQLDREVVDANDHKENQIARLIRMGVLAETASKVPPATIGRLARLDDVSASVEHRVRSYIDVNCSSCHNPNTRFAAFDARLVRDPGELGIVDGASYYHKEMSYRVRIVQPGDLSMSMLHHRMVSNDPCLRMPPLGTAVVDRAAADLVATWIKAMPPLPDRGPPPLPPIATKPSDPPK